MRDFADRLLAWKASGPKDIGGLTYRALSYLEAGLEPLEAGRRAWEDSGRQGAGNGSVMRCAPTALFRADDPVGLRQESRLASRVTHYDPRAQDACVVINTVMAALLGGATVGEAIESALSLEDLDGRTRGALGRLDEPDEFDLAGYCLGTMQAGLLALLETDSIEEGLVTVVGLGYDTDSNAAVAGALLGARFGYEAIPARWRDQLHVLNRLLEGAERVVALSGGERGNGRLFT